MEWFRDLVAQPTIVTHSGKFHSGDITPHRQVFCRVMFGLAAMERPQGLTREDLEPRGYQGLRGTRWWAVFASPLPIVLKRFLPIIFRQDGAEYVSSTLGREGK